MDEIDRKIIAVLQQNARISMRDLGKTISLSNTAVTERMRRLQESGVIRGYRAEVRQALLGKTVHAFILLECKYDVRCNPDGFLAFARAAEQVAAVSPILSGGMDYMLEVHCRDVNALYTFQQQLFAYGLSTTYLAEEKL